MFSTRFAPFVIYMVCVVSQPLLANPTLDIGGRLDLDAAKYYADTTPLESGIDLRRLRLELGGTLTKKIYYYVLSDFSDGHYAAEASWLRYRFDRQNELYAGRMEIPFSLQQVTNSQSNLFMERALPVALSRHYGTGLVYAHKGSNLSWRLGLFGEDRLNFGGSKSSGTALVLRGGRRLRLEGSQAWLGAAMMYQDINDSQRLRTRPESSVTDQQLVDSGRLQDIDNITRAGLEGLWKKDSWSVQGEWIQYRANRTGSADLAFSGGYIEVSRMLNGRRRFNFRSGEWMLPEVTNMKTWELAFRVSHIDLQDDLVSGGRESNYSLGLNFYMNPINRIMLNWIKTDVHPNSQGIDESPSLLQARLQIGF